MHQEDFVTSFGGNAEGKETRLYKLHAERC